MRGPRRGRSQSKIRGCGGGRYRRRRSFDLTIPSPVSTSSDSGLHYTYDIPFHIPQAPSFPHNAFIVSPTLLSRTVSICHGNFVSGSVVVATTYPARSVILRPRDGEREVERNFEDPSSETLDAKYGGSESVEAAYSLISHRHFLFSFPDIQIGRP